MSNMRLLALGCLVLSAAFASAEVPAPYDTDPHHPWNRVYDALYLRGLDSHRAEVDALLGDITPRDMLDPVLWYNTTYLLTEPSHSAAIALLDETIAAKTAALITDLRKRALFQRDLWAVFDWAAEQEARLKGVDEQRTANAVVLMDRLSTLMKDVALTHSELDALAASIKSTAETDTTPWTEPAYELKNTASLDAFYEKLPSGEDYTGSPEWKRVIRSYIPFLRAAQRPNPPVRSDPGSEWVYVDLAGTDKPLSFGHTSAFRGRSVFSVLVRTPDGREETLRYLRELGKALGQVDLSRLQLPNSADENGKPFDPELLYALEIPELPVGTTFALLRRPITILSSGDMAPLPFVESVQFFEHSEQTFEHPLLKGRLWRTAAFGEFHLERDAFFAGGDGLVRVGKEQGQFVTAFQTRGIDMLEVKSRNPDRPLKLTPALNCARCHSLTHDKSILTMMSLYNLTYLDAPLSADSLVSTRAAVEAKAMSFAKTQSGWAVLASRWSRP